jgi:hypothetical protein
MVNLVLEDAGIPIVKPEADAVAVTVLGTDSNRLVPADLAQVAGNGETTLNAVNHLPRRPNDLRVNNDIELARPLNFVPFVVYVCRRFDDRNSQRLFHLRAGKANSVGGAHRLNHVVNQRLEAIVEGRDQPRLLA